MAKVKGYYNTKNNTFLGPMTATNESTGVAYTPRYIEGVCFGEYDTYTNEFVPETNPMILPKGSIITQDDQFDANGNIITHTTGLVEDKGAEMARKKVFIIGQNKPTPKPKLIGLAPSTKSTNDAVGIDFDKLFR